MIYEQDLQQYSEMNKSRFLFQQIVEDNQPAQSEIIQRASQLQIQDLNMARQSLTREMQDFWRPYSNRNHDIYYINLKQTRAYIDHPVDMWAKIQYAQKYKYNIPQFKSYQLQQISKSLYLVEQQIHKYYTTDTTKTSKSHLNFTNSLNIVYQDSQQSISSRKHDESQSQQSILSNNQKQKDNQSQQQVYIQNLKKQANNYENIQLKNVNQNNKLSNKSIIYKKNDQIKLSKIKELSKFYQIDQKQYDQQTQLSPEYEQILLSYQQKIKQKYFQQLKIYQQKKQHNYQLKSNIYKKQYQIHSQIHKSKILAQYQLDLQIKNQQNILKQLQKIKQIHQSKINIFSNALQKDLNILTSLNQINNRKIHFIQNIQTKMQKIISIKTYNKISSMNQTLNNQQIHNKIIQLNKEAQNKFNYQLNQNLNHYIIKNGITDSKNPLTKMYENMIQKQLNSLNSLVLQSKINKEIRKRSKSIFNDNYKRHNTFIYDPKITHQNKQNIFNYANHQIYTNIIQQQIQKSKDQTLIFKKTRARIFSQKMPQITYKRIEQQNQIISQNQSKRIQSFSSAITINQQKRQNPNNRKSLYLKMMKRII